MKEENFKILKSPGFLISLFLLLLNDWLLKAKFHNFITGKISDFAGLFAFTLFFISFFPKHSKKIALSVCLFFIFWKSSLSTPLISFINYFGISYYRWLDQTDLIALPIVALALFYAKNYIKIFEKSFNKFSKPQRSQFNFLEYLIILISVFAFTSTSFIPQPKPEQKEYYKQLLEKWPRKYFNTDNSRIFELKTTKNNLIEKLRNKGFEEKIVPATFFHKETISFTNKNSKGICEPYVNLAQEIVETNLNSESVPLLSRIKFQIENELPNLSLKLFATSGCNYNDKRELSEKEVEEVVYKLIKD